MVSFRAISLPHKMITFSVESVTFYNDNFSCICSKDTLDDRDGNILKCIECLVNVHEECELDKPSDPSRYKCPKCRIGENFEVDNDSYHAFFCYAFGLKNIPWLRRCLWDSRYRNLLRWKQYSSPFLI